MRVLFLSNEMPYRRVRSAYAFRLEALRSALEAHGITTDFLSLREQPVSRPLLATPANLPFLVRKVADYDFIHAGGDAAYTAAFLKPFTRAQIVYDVHGDTLEEAKLQWQTQRDPRRAFWVAQASVINAVACRRADRFVAVSEPLRRRLVRERNIPIEKIGLIRNGVDLDLFQPTPAPETDEFVLAYAGGFQPWQAVGDIIAALPRLAGQAVRLKMIGFAAGDENLKASIAARLGDRVELMDKLPQADLVAQLRSAQLLLCPRPRHRAPEVGLPVKFAEYLALGKPVLVYDTDETGELVRRFDCGFVSEPNPQALAATIEAALATPREELRRLGENARRLAEQDFSWDIIGGRYADLLGQWSASADHGPGLRRRSSSVSA